MQRSTTIKFVQKNEDGTPYKHCQWTIYTNERRCGDVKDINGEICDYLYNEELFIEVLEKDDNDNTVTNEKFHMPIDLQKQIYETYKRDWIDTIRNNEGIAVGQIDGNGKERLFSGYYRDENGNIKEYEDYF